MVSAVDIKEGEPVTPEASYDDKAIGPDAEGELPQSESIQELMAKMRMLEDRRRYRRETWASRRARGTSLANRRPSSGRKDFFSRERRLSGCASMFGRKAKGSVFPCVTHSVTHPRDRLSSSSD